MLRKQTWGAQAPVAATSVSSAALKIQAPPLPVGASLGCLAWACRHQGLQSKPCPGCAPGL